MVTASALQSLSERRSSSLSCGPSQRALAPSPRHAGPSLAGRFRVQNSSRLQAVEPAQNGAAPAQQNGTARAEPATTGLASTIPKTVSAPVPIEVKPIEDDEPDRYGWPARSDMYILRTDGNVCARTLVKGTGRLQLAYPSSHQYMMVWKQKPKTVMIIKKLGNELMPELLKVAKYLAKQGINVILEPDVHQRLAEQGFFEEVYTFTPDQGKRLGDFIDFVICLGGDGVLLHTAQMFKDNVPPVVAFHLGSLGFMSQHSYGTFEEDVQGIVDGLEPLESCKVNNSSENQLGVYVSLRMRLKCEIKRAGKLGFEQTHEVLNEVVLDRGASSFLTNINVYESGHFMTCVQADGLMIATPTGSTAYSAAAGGSMVHPNVPAILFTPICAHSLNFRPIVLPDYSVLDLRISDGSRASVWVSFDGKHRQELHEGDMMRVRMSPNPVATINRLDQTQDWMLSLDRCFGWSRRIVQRPLDD